MNTKYEKPAPLLGYGRREGCPAITSITTKSGGLVLLRSSRSHCNMKKLFRKFDKKSKSAQASSPQSPQPQTNTQESVIPTQPQTTKDNQSNELASKQSTAPQSGFGVGIAGCPHCMDLNPHLASKATDGITEDSWARKEYNIPLETAAGQIKVKEAKCILETAQHGCIYCTILCIALNQMHPGWEVESFLKIFVASDLPVVVRLVFGKIVVVERYGAPGYVLPPGRTMNIEMEVTYPEKPPVDIEFYRPTFGPDSGGVNGMSCTVSTDLRNFY